MNEMELYSLENKKLQKDEREVFYVKRNATPKCRVLSRAEALEMIPDNKQSSNERAQRKQLL